MTADSSHLSLLTGRGDGGDLEEGVESALGGGRPRFCELFHAIPDSLLAEIWDKTNERVT